MKLTIYNLTKEDIQKEEQCIENAIKEYNKLWDERFSLYDELPDKQYSEVVKEHEMGVACIGGDILKDVKVTFRKPITGEEIEGTLFDYYTRGYVEDKINDRCEYETSVDYSYVIETCYGKIYAFAVYYDINDEEEEHPFVSKIIEATEGKAVVNSYNVDGRIIINPDFTPEVEINTDVYITNAVQTLFDTKFNSSMRNELTTLVSKHLDKLHVPYTEESLDKALNILSNYNYGSLITIGSTAIIDKIMDTNMSGDLIKDLK